MPYGRRGCRRNEGEPIPTVRRARTRHLEEDEEPATADAEGLRRFLEGEVLQWFEARKKELANRPLIREQAFGESSTPTSWSGSAATRSISTQSSNGPWPCCRASRTCGRRRSRADPFRKTNGGGHVREPGGLLSAIRRARFPDGLL